MHPIADLIVRRLSSGRHSGRHADGCKLALCVEGGAMRAATTGGMLIALERSNISRAFDAVYGVSAGAVNAAYFIAGQARYGAPIYYRHLINTPFIQMRQVPWGRPLLNIDMLVNDILTRDRTLNWPAVLSSPLSFGIVVTEVGSGRAALLRPQSQGTDVGTVFRDALRVPFPPSSCLSWTSSMRVDGSLADPLGISLAIADGATHLIVLGSRSTRSKSGRLTLVDRLGILPGLRMISPPLANTYRSTKLSYRATLDWLRRQERSRAGPPYILFVQVDGSDLRTIERNRQRVRNGMLRGIIAARRTLASIQIG
jgi:predicted patatin/cPLA2 family phospholipase